MEKDTKIKHDYVKGHRKRVKERFLKTGFDNWQDYEILEFALFFVIPRKDTKQTAKELLKKFGSFKELVNADYNDLVKACKETEGISINTAFFFYFLKAFSTKYSELKVKPKEKVSSPQDVVEFLKNEIGLCSEENLYAVFLDASNKVLKFKRITKGTTSRSAVYPEEFAKESLNAGKTRSVIIAHNHPGGVCKPSQNDIIATEAVQKALKTIAVVLLDHIIVTDTDYYSFKDNGLI
ncbi:JAB domain-containing protein [Candidatus Ruminimicrobiellum ovillum]|uniref:JAB domain-containing protein n=1 Tax=Candidatus Ruminimicrobiellum ovillum TaxID=1947927 RepID=UPI00355A6ED3